MSKRDLRRSMVVAVLGVAGVLGLSGCARLQVKLGMRVYLSKIPAITSMDVSLPKNPGMAPGEKSPLVVTFTEPNGKIMKTSGAGNGKVMWSDLTVTPSVVSVNKKGVLSLAWDPRVSEGKTGHVTITAPSHPELRAELDIPLRYNVPFMANYSGSSGASGRNGNDGSSGSMGSTGSMDPDNPSPGGDGGNGGDGENGQDGDAGGNAPNVDVRVAVREESPLLLQVSVLAQGRKQRFYLIDPQGGSLTVRADGGSGGSGGRGGRGGSGGMGGVGTPNGSNGSSGLDGRAGSDGTDGSGGLITVTYDPKAEPFLNALHLSNRLGPKPVFEEAPVGPLW